MLDHPEEMFGNYYRSRVMMIGKESLFFATLHISNQILCKKTGSPRGHPHRAGRPGHHRLCSPGGS